MAFTVNVLLTGIVYRDAGPGLDLFASIVDKFLSQVSYFPSYVFHRRRHSFTSRKLYARLVVPQDLNLTLYAQVC